MKLLNQTNYPTVELKRLLRAVHAKESARPWGQLDQWDKLVITVRYTLPDQQGNTDYYSGWAYLGEVESTLFVPPGKLHVSKLAGLWRHELWHLYGVDHHDMPEYIRDWTTRGCGYIWDVMGYRVMKEEK